MNVQTAAFDTSYIGSQGGFMHWSPPDSDVGKGIAPLSDVYLQGGDERGVVFAELRGRERRHVASLPADCVSRW